MGGACAQNTFFLIRYICLQTVFCRCFLFCYSRNEGFNVFLKHDNFVLLFGNTIS